MRARATLTYDVPPDVACAYLSDPVHRPEWQSSLRRVELRDVGEPHVGQRWEDHTAVGLVASMTTTALEPGVRWSESGTWRNVTADLTLTFEPYGSGCRVGVEFAIRVAGFGNRPNPLKSVTLRWIEGQVGDPSGTCRVGLTDNQREK